MSIIRETDDKYEFFDPIYEKVWKQLWNPIKRERDGSIFNKLTTLIWSRFTEIKRDTKIIFMNYKAYRTHRVHIYWTYVRTRTNLSTVNKYSGRKLDSPWS